MTTGEAHLADQDLLIRLAAMSRRLMEESDPHGVQESIVALAPGLVGGCVHASISVLRRKKMSTAAASHETAAIADRMQYEIGEGPCLEAATNHDAILCNDVANDERWSLWGPQVARETQVRALLSVPLFHARGTLGSLNLYATRPHAYDARSGLHATVLASHASVALSHSREQMEIRGDLDSRTVIGQACGILMERFGMTDRVAFGLLVRVSQHSNIKLRVIAARLVETRETPH